MDAGVGLEIRRAYAGAIDGGLGLGIDIQRVTAIKLDHLAGAEPDGNDGQCMC